MTEPADEHPDKKNLSMEDEVFLPNTYNSAPDPLEVTTSKEAMFLPKETGVVREKIEVVADDHKMNAFGTVKIG